MRRQFNSQWDWRYGAVAVLVLMIALIAWNWRSQMAMAVAGTGYAARMTCSCRYVEGRDMESCSGDPEEGVRFVRVTDEPEHKAVRARVPLLAEQRAYYRQGFGCLLEAR